MITVETIEPGQRYGKWVITGDSRLGGGGNGEVWFAESSDGQTGAIKILNPARDKNEGTYRLGRFKDEISFLIAHPDFPGIVPILDHQISDDLTKTSWYVMPVARTIRAALGNDPEPALVVTAIAEIATTLTVLTEEKVGHRDIKPDNLFELDGHWLIGDFGLVAYPDKDPRTEHGRKLGPTDYMAPEMRQDADQAAPGPADVWALAKTLWVLLAGDPLPLPGTHIATDPAHSLQERITYRFAAELDRMLEKATLIPAEQRITMADMAKELSACAAPPPEARPDASLEEYRERMAALTATSRHRATEKQAWRDEFRRASHEISKIVSEAAEELSALLNFDIHPAWTNGHHSAALLPQLPFSPYDHSGTGRLLIPPDQPRPAVQVEISITSRMQRLDGPADIAAILRVDRILDNGNQHEVHEKFARTYLDIPIGSAQQANVIADIRNGFYGGFSPAIREVIQIMSGADDQTRPSEIRHSPEIHDDAGSAFLCLSGSVIVIGARNLLGSKTGHRWLNCEYASIGGWWTGRIACF
jgi:serine/threonine protein kinase